MNKSTSPLEKLARYEGWLSGVAGLGIVLGVGLAWVVPVIGSVLIGIGATALIALLIAYPIRLAATAVVESVRDRDSVG